MTKKIFRDSKYKTTAELIAAEYFNGDITQGDINTPLEHGYEIRETLVRRKAYGAMEIAVEIFPYISWTNGSYAPCYCGGWDSKKKNTLLYIPSE